MPQVLSDRGHVIGVSNVDVQVSQMPAYTTRPLGSIVQYVGSTTSTYTKGFFYERTETGWEEIEVQPSQSSEVVYDGSASGSTATNVQDAVDDLYDHMGGITFRLVE